MNDQQIKNKFQLPNITQDMWEEMETVECNECGHKFFEERLIFKKIPGVLVGSSEPQVQPFNVIVCSNCKCIPDALDKDHKLRDIVDGKKKSKLIL